MTQSHDTKRIAKNTFIMYIRMCVMLLIGLYTSRVVLRTLGVADYGIYNVVGGVVAMFSIVSSSLSTSISRFLTFEIGHGDKQRLRDMFSTSVMVQLAMSLVLVLLMEIVGVWFLNNKMNIPVGRMDAANVVLQCSIFSFALGLLNIPFIAAIVAHERFGVFAYITLAESVLKLAVVYVLVISPYDKLDTYAVLLLLVSVLVLVAYWLYGRKNFEECRLRLSYDKTMVSALGRFTGWTLLGNGAYVLMTQGVNILMNLFFGVLINAARGITVVVENILNQFVSNFTTAINPQITKSYASGDLQQMQNLMYLGSKIAYMLMLVVALPVFMEAEFLLRLWLGDYPPMTPLFLRLTIVNIIIVVTSTTLITGLLATGDIGNYQLTIGVVSLLVLPVSYVLYRLGWPAYLSYVVQILVMVYELCVRIYYMKRLLGFRCLSYVRSVLSHLLVVTVAASVLPVMVESTMREGVLRFFVSLLCCLAGSVASVWVFGLSCEERRGLIAQVRSHVFHTNVR